MGQTGVMMMITNYFVVCLTDERKGAVNVVLALVFKLHLGKESFEKVKSIIIPKFHDA